MTRGILLILLLAGLFAAGVAPAHGTGADRGTDGRDYDCARFATQEGAQAYFEADGGSAGRNVDGLDDDGDGKVCEDLSAAVAGAGQRLSPTASTAGSPAPTASPEPRLPFTGDGRSAALVLVGGLLAVGGLVLLAVTRHRPRRARG